MNFSKKLEYVLKHNSAAYNIYSYIMSSLLRLVGHFIKQDDKMILFTALSRRYNDSPKYIYEYMISHPEYKNYNYIWGVEDLNIDIPGKAKKVKADTVSYFITSLKAKYWITSVNIERGLSYKKTSCICLNTWHGAPIKHGGNDAVGRNIYHFDSSVNLFCCSSEFERDIQVRSLGVNPDTVLFCGLPRNDELFHTSPEEVSILKRRLNLPLDRKIVIYAPTWRDSKDGGSTYSIKPPITIKEWEKRLGDRYVLLMRTHHYTNTLLGVEFNEFCRDFCSYPNINDLLKVSDIMISDYSAIIADYSVLERPVICFTYDYDDFSQSRGLYLDYDKEMPSGPLKTEEAVLKHLETMDYEDECRKTRKMLKNRLMRYGGDATEACVKALFEKSK